jgi:hypothetical protein
LVVKSLLRATGHFLKPYAIIITVLAYVYVVDLLAFSS